MNTAILHIEKLEKTYSSLNRKVLSGLDLTINRGDC